MNTPRTRVYTNNDGVFELNPYYNQVVQLADVYSSDVEWVDYNNDGLTDLFLTGTGYDSTLDYLRAAAIGRTRIRSGRSTEIAAVPRSAFSRRSTSTAPARARKSC